MSSTLARPVLKLDDHTLLERLLSQIRGFPARPGEDDATVVRRWLLTTETGMALSDYLAEEAGSLGTIAKQLNASDDVEQRRLARQVRSIADRLSAFAGVPVNLLERLP